MQPPVKVICDSVQDVPSAARIELLSAGMQAVFLVFPGVVGSAQGAQTLQRVVSDLTRQLSGYSISLVPPSAEEPALIKIEQVGTGWELLEHKEKILSVIILYQKYARRLMAAVLKKLDLPAEAFNDSVFRLRCAEVERLAGRIPIIQRQSVKRKGSQHESRERWKDWLLGKSQDEACWRYRFLPDRCQFVHGQTNQQVEVSLVCGGRFDVISEERFLQFLRTTEGLEAVTLLFADPSIRPELIFTLLVEQGELEQVFDKDGNLVGYTPKA